MPGYQYVVIVGHVGRDAEMRYTPSGAAVCDFSVAVNRIWADKASGDRVEEVTWFKVVCWRALAEIAGKYVTKGRQVMVAGRVSADAYIGKDGEPRASLNLTALDLQLLGARGDDVERETEQATMPF